MPNSSPTETINYDTLPSPIGQLLIAAADNEVVHLAFENHDFDEVLDQLEATYGGPVQHSAQALSFATTQLTEYFAGNRKYFDLALRKPSGNGFIATVQQHLACIPYGETRSYGEIATQLGRPGAARAVGTACAKNPMPLLQPCHRVVRADGAHGGFSGTTEAKKYLLAFERGEHPAPPTS